MRYTDTKKNRFIKCMIILPSGSECVFSLLHHITVSYCTVYWVRVCRAAWVLNTGAAQFCMIHHTAWPPPLARQAFANHWWNDSRRELSLKTLQVKDGLRESNGHRVTRRLRGVCVFVSIQYGKSTATSKNVNRWLHTLLYSSLHSSACSLLKKVSKCLWLTYTHTASTFT